MWQTDREIACGSAGPIGELGRRCLLRSLCGSVGDDAVQSMASGGEEGKESGRSMKVSPDRGDSAFFTPMVLVIGAFRSFEAASSISFWAMNKRLDVVDRIYRLETALWR